MHKWLEDIINMKSLVMFLCIVGSLASNSTNISDNIPVSPSVLSGILITLMLIVFLGIGMNMLSIINGPMAYSNVPLLVGKER